MPYTQTTYETCLACCLLSSATKKVTKKLELDCILHSMNYSKDDFVSGHTDFIKKKFGFGVTRYVGFPAFARYLRRKKLGSVEIANITLPFVDSLISKQPILLIDTKVLAAPIHYPHYVIVRKKKKINYEIYDPWDGKIKTVSAKKLRDGIRLLQKQLLMSPQLLVVNKK